MQNVPAILPPTLLQSLWSAGACHVKKPAVYQSKHVTGHAIPNQREVVEGVGVPVVGDLRQLDEAHGNDDTNDALHRLFGYTALRPFRTTKVGFLLRVSLRPVGGPCFLRAEDEVLVCLSERWDVVMKKINLESFNIPPGIEILKGQ